MSYFRYGIRFGPLILGQETEEEIRVEEAVTAVDIWNTALAELGRAQVQSEYDTSDSARRMRPQWNVFRRRFLTLHDFGGCTKTTEITSIESTFKPDHWDYEFLWPSDCLKVHRVNGKENMADGKVLWDAPSDSGGTRRTIYSNDGPTVEAYYSYDQRNMQVLPPAVAYAMGLDFAVHCAQLFGKSVAEKQAMERRAKTELNRAIGVDASESSGDLYQYTEITDAYN